MNPSEPQPEQHEGEQASTYSTRELAMAAFLSLRGYMFELRKDGESQSGHPVGSWIFKDRDEQLGAEVQAYNEGDAKVDPSKFLNEVNSVRKAMFAFLDIPKRY